MKTVYLTNYDFESFGLSNIELIKILSLEDIEIIIIPSFNNIVEKTKIGDYVIDYHVSVYAVWYKYKKGELGFSKVTNYEETTLMNMLNEIRKHKP